MIEEVITFCWSILENFQSALYIFWKHEPNLSSNIFEWNLSLTWTCFCRKSKSVLVAFLQLLLGRLEILLELLHLLANLTDLLVTFLHLFLDFSNFLLNLLLLFIRLGLVIVKIIELTVLGIKWITHLEYLLQFLLQFGQILCVFLALFCFLAFLLLLLRDFPLKFRNQFLEFSTIILINVNSIFDTKWVISLINSLSKSK